MDREESHLRKVRLEKVGYEKIVLDLQDIFRKVKAKLKSLTLTT